MLIKLGGTSLVLLTPFGRASLHINTVHFEIGQNNNIFVLIICGVVSKY